MDIKEGSLVISKNGRDKDKHFVVMQIAENYVYLCDGDMRKIENPKKKKIRHIQITGKFSDFLNKAISEGVTVTNKEVQKEIAKYFKEGSY